MDGGDVSFCPQTSGPHLWKLRNKGEHVSASSCVPRTDCHVFTDACQLESPGVTKGGSPLSHLLAV